MTVVLCQSGPPLQPSLRMIAAWILSKESGASSGSRTISILAAEFMPREFVLPLPDLHRQHARDVTRKRLLVENFSQLIEAEIGCSDRSLESRFC